MSVWTAVSTLAGWLLVVLLVVLILLVIVGAAVLIWFAVSSLADVIKARRTPEEVTPVTPDPSTPGETIEVADSGPATPTTFQERIRG